MGWRAGVLYLAVVRDISPLDSIQTICGPQPDSYATDTGEGALYLGIKGPGRETDYSPSSAEV